MLQWISQLTDNDLEQFQWLASNKTTDVPLMDAASTIKATRPIKNFIEKKFFG